jgi:hypothetical protein
MAPAETDGAEQARSLRAPPAVDARIAKDAAEFNAAIKTALPDRAVRRPCHIPTGRDLS